MLYCIMNPLELTFSMTLTCNYSFLWLSSADLVHPTDSKEDGILHKMTLRPSSFNCVLYGLPNLIVM